MVSWNGRGLPPALERDRLAVEHDRLDLEGGHHLDDLGHPVRDVREVARERFDLVPAAVNLQARAVQLPLDPGRADARERVPEMLPGLREHRLQRLQDGQAELP